MGLLAARSLSPSFPNPNAKNTTNPNYNSTNNLSTMSVPLLHTKYTKPDSTAGSSAENPLLLSALEGEDSPLPIDTAMGDASGDNSGGGSVVKSDISTVVVGSGGRSKMTDEEKRTAFTKVRIK